MPTKGILYVVWGGEEHRQQMAESIATVQKMHPEIPIHIADLDIIAPDHRKGLPFKAWMDQLSPFDITLFLDTDTKVIGDISYGFECAELHGMAITIDHACYARRWPELQKLIPDTIHSEIVEYNTGVIFFNKAHPKIAEVFEQWRDWSGISWNDQPSFAIALARSQFSPFVLPDHVWNYRVYNADRLFGPVKIWHTEKPNHLTPEIEESLTKNVEKYGWRMYNIPAIAAQDPADRASILQL